MTNIALRAETARSLSFGSRPSRLGVAGVLATLLALPLAGCATSVSTARPASSVKTVEPVRLLAAAPLPRHVDNTAALRHDVVQTSCSAIPGGWSATGTARNPGAKPATYKITVFFTTTHATTLNFAVVTVRVAPGRTAHWTAAKKFQAQAQMLCPMPGIAKVR